MAEKVSQGYTPSDRHWRISPWMQQIPRPQPVFLVTRSSEDMVGVYRDYDEAKANILARVLNELDQEFNR